MLDNGLKSKPTSNLAVHTKFISSSEDLHCHSNPDARTFRASHSRLRRSVNMRRKLMWLALCITRRGRGPLPLESARATTASGFSGQNLIPIHCHISGISGFNHLTRDAASSNLPPRFPGRPGYPFKKPRAHRTCTCRAIPGTWRKHGWHRHPGHSLIVITSGQVTQYHADCTPEVYGPGTANGSTLVDSGNDEHLIRNEGSAVATGFAVQLVASGAPRRIDVPTAPETCQLQ